MKTEINYWLSVTLFFIAMLLTPSGVLSQELKESYERSALTILFTSYGGRYERDIKEAIERHDFVPEQFYSNPVNPGVINLPAEMAAAGSEKKQAIFSGFLQQNHTGREVVGLWYNYRKGKGFDLSRLFERAEYNATDEEVLVSQASIRGEARIRDFGSKLVQNSYVLIIDITNIGKIEQEKDSDPYGWEARMGYYLYKLQFGDEESAALYAAWIYPDDSDSVRNAKAQLFNDSQYPLKLATERDNILTTGMNYLAAIRIKPTFEELFVKLLKNSVESATTLASSEIPDFQVQTKVTGRRPLSAKIGKKEGLRTDHRYFVYEYVWDEQEEQAVPHRKAVIRAKRIADNRKKATGTTIPSSFYQTYGGTIKEGMTIKMKRDVGLSLSGSYVSEGLGGANLRAMYRTGPFTGVPALYVIGGIGFSSEDYAVSDLNAVEDNYSFFRYDVGIGKGWRLFRLLEIMPYATFGREAVTVEDTDYAAFLLKGGFYGGISVLHNVALFGDVNWVTLGEAQEKVGEEYQNIGYDWDQLFTNAPGDGRSGGMAVELGIRFGF